MNAAVPTSPSLDATAIRSRLIDALRRDLIGPGPRDQDLARERLKDNPSRWYLSGYLAPAIDMGRSSEVLEDEGDPVVGEDEGGDPQTGRVRAADDAPEDEGPARHTRVPSSFGLTVLIDAS